MSKQTFTTGQILTAAQMTTLQANDYNWTVNAKVASYVLVATDAGTRITMNSASATTITVNTALFTAGDTLEIINIGAGVCTVTAGTATVTTSATLALKQWDAGTLFFTSTSASVFISADAADINSPLTTKGDLYTYSTDNTRLAVGANGTSLVADSTQTTGLGWSATPSASNPVINSAMQVWQRGTSIACSSTAYTADRWQGYRAVAGATVSRQATGDTTNLPNIQYAARVQRDNANTSTSAIAFNQTFESVNSIPFAGKTVTMSFYARAGANYSAASSALTTFLYSGTGTDQNAITGFTGQTNVIAQSAILTTTWQRFTYTATIASTATQLATQVQYTPVGTAGAADYFEVTGVQIDIGSVALPFRTYAATIQQELAACQRYYYRIGSDGAADAGQTNVGLMSSTTQFRLVVLPPVTFRTLPSAVDYSNLRMSTGAAQYTVTAVTLNDRSSTSVQLNVTITTGPAAGSAGYLIPTAGSTTSYLALSAEL